MGSLHSWAGFSTAQVSTVACIYTVNSAGYQSGNFQPPRQDLADKPKETLCGHQLKYDRNEFKCM